MSLVLLGDESLVVVSTVVQVCRATAT